jgi:hypothetical protein
MIDETLASQAQATFMQVTGGSWPRPLTEIQDDGKFVLLIVEVPASWDRTELGNRERTAVISALNELIPIPPDEPVGAWIVCFKGKFSDSILPNEL